MCRDSAESVVESVTRTAGGLGDEVAARLGHWDFSELLRRGNVRPAGDTLVELDAERVEHP
jgi:hypothetical protein